MHVGALQLLGDNESTLSASRPPSTIECGTKAANQHRGESRAVCIVTSVAVAGELAG
jgi:hypothetical protein